MEVWRQALELLDKNQEAAEQLRLHRQQVADLREQEAARLRAKDEEAQARAKRLRLHRTTLDNPNIVSFMALAMDGKMVRKVASFRVRPILHQRVVLSLTSARQLPPSSGSMAVEIAFVVVASSFLGLNGTICPDRRPLSQRASLTACSPGSARKLPLNAFFTCSFDSQLSEDSSQLIQGMVVKP